MNITEFLRNRNADLAGIVTSARASVGLAPSDVLLAVGSLVEGLGNSKSDLDLLLVTPRDADVIPSCEVALVVGKCLADVQVLPLQNLEPLLARFNEWSALPWDLTHAPNFSLEERRLLHRLLHSAVIFEGAESCLSSLRPRLDRLARLKLQVARYVARTIQVDMAGNRDADDYLSLVFAAQELLGHAVDALAAGHHLTNPTAKWRTRVLEFLPVDWERPLRVRPTGLSASQVFWSLHRAPEHPNRALALAHAFRIATFARAVFVWAERKLLFPLIRSQNLIDLSGAHRATQDARLPYLDLDVDFSESGGGVSLGRLNEFDDPLELSSCEFEITLLFDGVTTAREALLAVYGMGAVDADRRIVENVISGVARAGLSVPFGRT